MRARLPRGTAALAPLLWLATTAHVGDDNTHFRGPAGPWTIQVTVRHPGVVPGLADVLVRVEEPEGVTRVTVRPVAAAVGREGAPSADEARPVPGRPGVWSAQLWMMTGGAYSVDVTVEGARGSGVAVVPVMSMATRVLEMDGRLGALLAAFGLVLFAGLVTIVRAGASEALLAPGVAPDRRQRVRGWAAAALAVVLLTGAVGGGRAWWDAEDRAYRQGMFERLALDATVRADPAASHGRVLELRLSDPRWLAGEWTPLVPDHGKLMHVFLVGEDARAFAHLHPEPLDGARFELALPLLPAGRYALYADVTHESGFAQTLVAEVDLAGGVSAEAPEAARQPDPDDSWWTGEPAVVEASGGSAVARLPGGAEVRWMDPPARVAAGEDLLLRFEVVEADGSPAALEPYMGMAAHAAVRRSDGGVFVHLHPMGSIYAAARERMAEGQGAGPLPHAEPHLGASHEVSIPYAFPSAGRYHLWVQVKRSGEVVTAAFRIEVAE